MFNCPTSRACDTVVAAGLWLVRRGRLCEDLCFGHDSRGEVPRGALDSKDGSVHCSGVMVGVGGKGVLVRGREHITAYP
jgi:hypothetical protein